MSRTIRNRHNRGRDFTIDIERELRLMEARRYRGYAWYTPEKIAEIIRRDIQYNARLHRDGFHNLAWRKRMKIYSARTLRRSANAFIHTGDWDNRLDPTKWIVTSWDYD